METSPANTLSSSSAFIKFRSLFSTSKLFLTLESFVVRSNNLSEQWDEAAESWIDFVRERKDFYREEMNNPAFFKLVGNIKGKKTLDLACGEGSNTRILARKGAKVVGVDFSKRLVEFARQQEKKEKVGIEYFVSDAADLREFPNGHFDIVTCSMALMDIENYRNAILEAARVLKRNGRFVFSIVHPCFEWGDVTSSGQQIGEWKYEEGTEDSSRRALHYETTRYFGRVKLKSSWDMKRLIKPFITTSFHRTLTDYVQALFESGLLIRRLLEPRPTMKGVSEHPKLRKHRKIPHSIIIEAIKK
jgi:ubiquinone/menaquinone biosynthesis C-methylase UbiE